MAFEELEIKTQEFIEEFDSIEKRKKEILKNLESGSSPIFDELNRLSALLNQDEIPLLNIILQKLDFIEEHKRGLERIAIRGNNDFYWRILERIDKLRGAVLQFLKRAEEDASFVREILFYWEHPTERKPIAKWVKGLIKSLKRDIKLEERLNDEDTYNILEDYLRFAERNAQDSKISSIVKMALKRTNIGRIAACFLVALLTLEPKVHSAELQP